MTGSLKHTISPTSVGEVRGDLHQTPLVDTHSHQSFVHPFDQLLLADKHVVGAATVIAETDQDTVKLLLALTAHSENKL